MNNILKSVSNLKEVYRKAGLEFSFDSEKMIKELTENSYKNNAIENLVNVFNGEESTLDISEYQYIEDYEILTYVMRDEDYNEFESEEEYQEHLKEKANDKFEKYNIIESKDEDGEEIFELIDDEDDVIDYFYSKDEAEEELERLKDEFIEESPKWDELDRVDDEIYWNTVYQPSFGVDVESAQRAGLGVLELHGEQYLFLTGCGMDMSFQFVKYYAYADKALPIKYLDKLEWTKQNTSSEEFKHVLSCLGVDTSKLSNL